MPAYDVAIIGAGPGGYVAAIRAAQLGLSTVIVEKESVGGVCLNWGCIPSKALLYGAEVAQLFKRASDFGIGYSNLTLDLSVSVQRSRDIVAKFVAGVETLLEQNKVTLIRGTAKVEAPDKLSIQPGGNTIDARNIIIATGGFTRSLPNVPVDGDRVITSREALDLRQAPRSIVIVGGGAVGVEFAYLYRAYGSEVTIVEFLPRLLPNEDEDIGRQLERSFRETGINVRVGTRVDSVAIQNDGVRVAVAAGDKKDELKAHAALIGVGFGANTDGLGLTEIGVEMENGAIKIDDFCRTSVPGVWAIGDVTGKLPLAHVASHQGVTAVETIAGRSMPPLDYDQIPRAVYCQPQVGALGLTEEQARQRGYDVRTGRFPFRANGKALATGDLDGFVKVVADEASGQVLGVHMIGHNVTELLAEASLATVLEATTNELSYAVQAHPTLSEAIKEAALAVRGEAIHFYAPVRS
jgi:dihydrolipoamide dehydrogenase